MYLRKISIKNFRVFGEKGVDLVFHKGVNAIIGENNAGKSAVIDAIRIAFTTLTYNKNIYFTQSDFHVDHRGIKAETAQIDVYLEDVPKELIEIWNPEPPSSTGEFHLQFYSITTPSGEDKVKYKVWGGKKEGNSLSADTLEAINIAFLGALRDAENEMRPSRTSQLAKLLNTVIKDEQVKEALVAELQKANKSVIDMDPVKNISKIVNSNLSDIEQEVLKQQVNIGLVDPKFDSIASSLKSWITPKWCFISKDVPKHDEVIRLCREYGCSKLYEETNDGIYLDCKSFLETGIEVSQDMSVFLESLINHTFELYQNGLGYNNLLFMAVVLGDMSWEKKGVYLNLFLIEEPEAHLHPQLQRLVHGFFERKCKESASIQAIYTSHSPTLVSRIGINSINLLYEDSHSAHCYPLTNASLDDADLLYLEKYLDVTKSQMFFAKGIVFVEGISEAILLPEMAKILERPFDKYAVEVVNVNGTSFAPFAKLLKSPTGMKSFVKAAVITDDDRCVDKSKSDYIGKDIDYDDDIAGLSEKLEYGSPSERYKRIKDICAQNNITLCGAKKTLEYELALHEDNISYIVEAIKSEFPTAGSRLEEKIAGESDIKNKALRIWLFIRARDKSKGQIAQALCRIIKGQNDSGETVNKPFCVPDYITEAIYAVTRPQEE
ncbi:MAG TPA: AAA family ATPase [Bacillota bacterium]|nr:AAA family ATPase [Bacillota bacterium]